MLTSPREEALNAVLSAEDTLCASPSQESLTALHSAVQRLHFWGIETMRWDMLIYDYRAIVTNLQTA